MPTTNADVVRIGKDIAEPPRIVGRPALAAHGVAGARAAGLTRPRRDRTTVHAAR